MRGQFLFDRAGLNFGRIAVLEICGSSLLLGHVFAPNLCITGYYSRPKKKRKQCLSNSFFLFFWEVGGRGGGGGAVKQGMVGNVILPNMKTFFCSHANKTHSHIDVFYTLPRFESEDFWSLEIAQ